MKINPLRLNLPPFTFLLCQRDMDDTRFHAIANATLEHCYDQLEAAYDAGDIKELDLEDGILNIQTATGKIFLLNKHGPSKQLWLASPVSGGLHFSYASDQRWTLPNGTLLYDLLRRELAAEQIMVVL